MLFLRFLFHFYFSLLLAVMVALFALSHFVCCIILSALTVLYPGFLTLVESICDVLLSPR